MIKRAIVFGATSGIGKEVALLLFQRGYRVGVIGRRGDKLSDLVSDTDGQVMAMQLDLTHMDLIPQAVDGLIKELGGVDLVVLSSGCGDINHDLDFEIERVTVELNVMGFTRVVDHVYSYFSKHQGGHIIGVTSVMGLRGSGAAPAYSATKAYQINYLESLRQRSYAEGANIRVTDVRPGSVDTDMMKGEGHFWISTPTKAAEQIVSAIIKSKEVVYVSKRWRLIGWVLKLLPRSLFNRMGRM